MFKFKKITNFFKNIPYKGILVITLFFVAAFLRLYNLPNTLTFQADQARDAIIVSRIFIQHKPVFIGPVTSVGNMYLGPLYYYFMLPFLILSYPSPLGPAYGIALCGILTIVLFYFLGQKMLGESAGIISAILATFSTTLIYYSRFSWNPCAVPLVSLLMMYFTYLAWKKSPKYWLIVAATFSILLQLHYLTLIMAFGAGFFWVLSLTHILKLPADFKKPAFITFFKFSFLSLLILLISFTPLVFFDIRHSFVNLKAFESIFTTEKILTNSAQSSFSTFILGTIRESHGRTIEVLFTLFFGKIPQIQNVLLVVLASYLFYFVKRFKKIEHADGQLVVIVFLITSIIGISAYKRSVFDHYLLFIIPMSLWFFASIFANFKNFWLGKIVLIGFLFSFGWYNIQNISLKSAGWTIYKVQSVAKVVESHLQPNEKYDVVLLSDSGDFYGMNYRYFLNTMSIKPIEYDVSEPVNTLVIINENQKNKSSETLSAYQIEVFGKPKSIDRIVENDGPNIEIWRK